MYNEAANAELESLYVRLSHQTTNAFFCVSVDVVPMQLLIAEDIRARFPPDSIQTIDFKDIGGDFIFSSASLINLIHATAKILFLVNFQLACGDQSDAEFFQTLSLSRDALADLPCTLVFMMPKYFRIMIARKAPDFNSFFQYHAEFSLNANDVRVIPEPEQLTGGYSATKKELLEYYREQFNSLINQNDKRAFEIVLKILELNADVRGLFYAETNRFYNIFQKLLPIFQNDSNVSANVVANIYYSLGKYDKAIELYQYIIDFQENVLGTEHPNTAATYNNIALIYVDQRNYPKALEWYQKALTIREKVLGTEHPDTATTYNNIAAVYFYQGDYPKALDWYQKSLAIREKALGMEHPDTAATYNGIGTFYIAQGDYPRALEWLQRSLSIFEKVLGTENLVTATTYNNIAIIYVYQRDFPKALELIKKTLAIRKKILGTEYPDTITTYNITKTLRDLCTVNNNPGDNNPVDSNPGDSNPGDSNTGDSNPGR